MLYAIDGKSVAAAIDATTGETLWKRRFDSRPGRPVLLDGSLLYPHVDTRLEHVDPAEGATVRVFPSEVPTTDDNGRRAVVVAGDLLVSMTAVDGGHLVARTTEGDVVWHRRPTAPRSEVGTERTVFVTENAESTPRLTMLDAATGEPRWDVELPPGRPPGRSIVCDEHVFVRSQRLVSVDRETGVISWERDYTVATMAVAGETLYLTTWKPGDIGTTDSIVALDTRNGEQRWQYDGFAPTKVWKITAMTDAGPVLGIGNRLVRFGPKRNVIDQLSPTTLLAGVGGVLAAGYLWYRSR